MLVTRMLQAAAGKNIAPPAGSYRDIVVADSPEAYWRLDETTGTTLSDEMGSYPANLSGSYTLGQTPALAGGDGKSIKFIDGHFSPASSPLPGGETTLSIEWWMKDNGTPNCYVMSRSNADDLIYKFAGNNIEFFGGNFSRSGSSMLFPQDGAWHHCVYTYDGVVLRGYIDAALKISHNQLTAFSTSSLFRWGRSTGNSDPLNGWLDEVAVYKRVLSAAEIQNHYDVGSGV